jgi:demethylmenaquinone methyltransferase / 2-methoxy-6-polyprenyl-1,4-benzoquinol methylase
MILANFLLEIYRDIASRYELTNHVLTFGLDYYWRKKAADIAASGNGNRWLDMCTGTGEFALALKKRVPDDTVIHAADFSSHMLQIAENKKEAKGIIFQNASSYDLPYENDYFDLVTISFALRNLRTGTKKFNIVFDEIFRVLKPGGRFINIETSQPGSLFVKFIFKLYVKYFTPFLGGLISGSPKGFKYLSASILNFYSASNLSHVIEKSGFQNVQYTNLLFGIISIHKAAKK